MEIDLDTDMVRYGADHELAFQRQHSTSADTGLLAVATVAASLQAAGPALPHPSTDGFSVGSVVVACSHVGSFREESRACLLSLERG